ncbi:MAG: hypothetical protein E7309_04500 [Butyrivibrio sp.]|nr:hypothetical protein [Butyrivibrio sp.]
MKKSITISQKNVICYNSIIDATEYKYVWLDYQPDMKTINYLTPAGPFEFYNLYLDYPVITDNQAGLNYTIVNKEQMDYFLDWLHDSLRTLIENNALSADCLRQYIEFTQASPEEAGDYIVNECFSLYEKRISKLFSKKRQHTAMDVLDETQNFMDLVDALPSKTSEADDPIVLGICAAAVCIQIAVEIFFMSQMPER